MVGILTNNNKFSIFKIGDLQIKFKTSPFLQKYTYILKWNKGYIECMAKYSTLDTPIEEYIDLRYIAKRLRLPEDIFDNVILVAWVAVILRRSCLVVRTSSAC